MGLPEGAETRAYISALLLVAGLAVGAFILSERALSDSALHVAINVSGRQRMLSQRIARLTLELSTSPNPASQVGLRDDMRRSVDQFERAHHGLVEGAPALGLPPPPPRAHALYFDGPPSLHAVCARFVADARLVLDSPRPLRRSPPVARILRTSRGDLLVRLDAVVAAYERAASEQLVRTGRIRLVLLALLLAVLAGQVLFIFHPLVKRLRAQRAAIASERDWIAALVDNLSDSLIVFDDDLKVLRCNENAERKWGRGLVGRAAHELVDPAAAEDLQHPGTLTRSTEARGARGRFPLEYRVSVVTSTAGRQTVLTGRDVSDERRYQQALRIHEQAFHSASDAMVVCTAPEPGRAPDQIEVVNTAFLSATGLSWGAVLGKPFSTLLAASADEEQCARIARAFANGESLDLEVPFENGDGVEFWVELSVAPVQSESGPSMHVVCVFRDITERRAREREAWAKANVDAVTGLSNRWSFEHRLESVIEQAQLQGTITGLLFIDLDGFKAVNDTLGHDAGDELLRTIAQRLRAAVRGHDLVARLGGDEFVIVLENVRGGAEAEMVAGRVLESVCAPIQLASGPAQVGASVGVALCPTHAEDASELVRVADQAMYEAKHAGKGRVVVAKVSAQTPAA